MPGALALIAAALFGAGDFFGGVASRRGSPVTVAATAQAVGLIGLAVFAPLVSSGAPARIDLLLGAGAGFTGAVGLLLLFHGLAIGMATVVAPITAVCSIAIPVLVDLLSGAMPRAATLVGIGIAMLAVALLSRGGGEWSRRAERAPPGRTVAVAIASGVMIGLFLTCLGRTQPGSGLWPLLAARATAVPGLLVACAIARRPFVAPAGARAAALASGTFDLAANALYLIAVRAGSLGPIATLASLYPASTVALAYVVWHERLRRMQAVGLVLAIVAIALITWRAPR